jgi:hypothetical protein
LSSQLQAREAGEEKERHTKFGLQAWQLSSWQSVCNLFLRVVKIAKFLQKKLLHPLMYHFLISQLSSQLYPLVI